MPLATIARYVVRCDGKGCNAWASSTPAETYCTLSEAYEVAKALGWSIDLAEDRAVCPKCWDKEKIR